jgi:hypothetical protein
MFRFILSHAQAIQDCIKQKNTTWERLNTSRNM